MPDPLLIAKDTTGKVELNLLPGLANRHGLIAGATGTGPRGPVTSGRTQGQGQRARRTTQNRRL
jgi:hypothetical protein